MKKKSVASLLFGVGLMASVSSMCWAQSNRPVRGDSSFANPSRLDAIPGGVSIGGSPALTLFQGSYYLAHKGHAFNDRRVFYTTCLASTNCLIGANWQQPEQIILPDSLRTTRSPALAVFNNTLYLVHKGAADTKIYYTRCSNNCTVASTNGTSNWTSEKTVPNAAMIGKPALAAFKGRLWLAYTNDDLPLHIYYASFDGTTWGTPTYIPSPGVATLESPTLAGYDNKLYVAYQGVQASQGEPDGKLHYTYGTFNIFGQLSGWLSEQTAPSYVQMSDSPALGVGGGTLFFAYHDLNSNVFKSIGLSPGGTWFANSVTQDGGVKMSGSPALAPENSLGAFTGTDGAANVTSGW